MKQILPILFIVFTFFANTTLQGQDAMTKDQARLLKEMQRTANLLNSTRKNKAAILDEFYVLQRQIEQRGQLIHSLEKRINRAAIKMERSAIAVDSLELDIEKLKVEYGGMIRQAYRSKMSNNELLFLFSAKSFSQALKRWRYLQQYDEYRKKQINLILETQMALKQQIRALEEGKEAQEQLLFSEESQKREMQVALSNKGILLTKLKKEENTIARLFDQQKMAHEALNQALVAVITADVDQHSETSNTALNTTKTNKRELAADINDQFAKQKGKMVWPIQNGVITRYFGNQAHPIHKKIMVNNNGIDIRARSDRSVFSLHEGLVTAIQIVPGYLNTLILQHGDYYTVYSNLETIKVKKGDIVLAQQVIGMVGVNTRKDYPELHLEIWKGKNRLNPFSWLREL